MEDSLASTFLQIQGRREKYAKWDRQPKRDNFSKRANNQQSSNDTCSSQLSVVWNKFDFLPVFVTNFLDSTMLIETP